MIDFTWYNPTKIIFGKETHRQVGEETARWSRKVLLHYGGKSIKVSGVYEAIVTSLREAGVSFVELGGVCPNPRLSLVREGIDLCRREGVDFILAAGGGSVIDSAKAIGAGVPYEGDVWDFYTTERRPERVLPLGVVLTIPAAGSESSDGSVITREEGPDKRSFCSDLLYPRFAILNPALCYTLPRYQISAGGADILAHVMERYFSPNQETDLSDRLCESAMKALIHNLPRVLENPRDYNAWAEVMWTGNVAHNGILGKGRADDWASHAIEHELSAVYDIAHGAGLAIVFPAWMKYVSRSHPAKLVRFAREVFGISQEEKEEADVIALGIRCLEDFYRKIGLPVTLHEGGIGREAFDLMAGKAVLGGTLGSFQVLDKQDVKAILELAE